MNTTKKWHKKTIRSWVLNGTPRSKKSKKPTAKRPANCTRITTRRKKLVKSLRLSPTPMKCCPTAKNDATMTPQVTKMADEQASAAPVVSAASLISLKRSSAGEEAVVRPPVHAAAKMPSSQLILILKKRCLGPKRRSKSKLPFVVIAVRVPPWNQVPTQKPVVPVVVPARSPVLSNRFWVA